MMLTADNITYEQIEKLYDESWQVFASACRARGLKTPVFIDMERLPEDMIYAARAECAKILNERGKLKHPEVKINFIGPVTVDGHKYTPHVSRYESMTDQQCCDEGYHRRNGEETCACGYKQGTPRMLTVETITDEQIGEIDFRYGDEWVEVQGRRLKLSWWAWEAVNSQHETLKLRGRQVCVDFINARDPNLFPESCAVRVNGR